MTSALTLHTGQLLAEFLNGDAPTPPAAFYVALFNGDPRVSGVEITADFRPAGRVAVTMGTPVDGAWANSGLVDFGASAAGSLSLSHYAIFDASTAGNMLFVRNFADGPYAIRIGTTLSWAIGNLAFQFGE